MKPLNEVIITRYLDFFDRMGHDGCGQKEGQSQGKEEQKGKRSAEQDTRTENGHMME